MRGSRFALVRIKLRGFLLLESSVSYWKGVCRITVSPDRVLHWLWAVLQRSLCAWDAGRLAISPRLCPRGMLLESPTSFTCPFPAVCRPSGTSSPGTCSLGVSSQLPALRCSDFPQCLSAASATVTCAQVQALPLSPGAQGSPVLLSNHLPQSPLTPLCWYTAACSCPGEATVQVSSPPRDLSPFQVWPVDCSSTSAFYGSKTKPICG